MTPQEKALKGNREPKPFGSEYNRKEIKRTLKKSKNYRIKHF